MDSLQMRSMLAGLCWGIWPFLLQRSRLTGDFSSFAFTVVILVCVAPFALKNVGDLSQVNWLMLIGAAICSATGLRSFNGMIEKATSQNLGSLFVLMIVVQISVPAIYDVVSNGGITVSKGIAFVLAVVVVVLLNK
jgi:hypothetical protein